jgi:hypothetical protein
MRSRAGIAALVVAICLAAPGGARTWSFDAHRFITDRAIDRLPPEIKPFFDRYRAFIVEHSIDPDLWRVVGWEQEPARHFLDLDAYGKAPFAELPRDYDRAIERYGADTLRKNGLLPWRTAEIYERLRQAFGETGKGTAPYAARDVQFCSAILSHYVADAHVPFHATMNHDGQKTGQRGIHARFESEFFSRYRDRWTISPVVIPPVSDPRGFIFDRLTEDLPLASRVLTADREAAAAHPGYDDAYYEEMYGQLGDMMATRLSAAIAGTAAMITGAWEGAGRPVLPHDGKR